MAFAEVEQEGLMFNCDKVCSGCTDVNRKREKTNGKTIPKTECLVAHYFDDLSIEYELHTNLPVECPFNKNLKRQCDFYLPKYNLYIEIKGVLTLSEINKIMWLQRCSGVNVHVLVLDNEDWDGYCDEKEGKSTEKKKLILEKQINEICALKENRIAVCDLVKLSELRILEYAITRSADIIRWNKFMIERKMARQ